MRAIVKSKNKRRTMRTVGNRPGKKICLILANTLWSVKISAENILPRSLCRLPTGLLVLLIIAACRSETARPTGYLIAAIESYPLQLDPRYATDANAVRIGNLIYNSLLRPDERSRLQPELAESWRMIDHRNYLFDLRRDVKFHNGRALTAADVKFTYESILDS